MKEAFLFGGYYDGGVTKFDLNGNMFNIYTHINTGLNPPYIDCVCSYSNAFKVVVTVRYTKNE